MVEMSAKRYEVDPFVPINVREMIKPVANEDVFLYTKPSQVVSQHE